MGSSRHPEFSEIGGTQRGPLSQVMLPRIAVPLAVIALLGMSCTEPPLDPPHNLHEYTQMMVSHRNAFPRKTIQMKNMQRVLDSDLSAKQRLGSLELLMHLRSDSAADCERLSLILSEPENPGDPDQFKLQRAVLSFLLQQNYPDLAGYVVPALGQANQDPQLRESILEWLMRNPSPKILSEIVRLWSEEPSVTGTNEPRFRHIVERVTGRTWDEALLGGINSRQSFARGRALEILTARMASPVLKKRIMTIHPETDAMAALQSFIETFGYLPSKRAEFATLVTVFRTRLEMIRDVSRLQEQWGEDYGYVFKVRDFHLLSRLSRDPLRSMLRRTQLILELSVALAKRQHVQHRPGAGTMGRFYTDRFDAQARYLGISDLWNLYLLDEMLARPRIQLALRIMADRIRSEPGAARHGLVFYQHGQAEAVLYPPPEEISDGSGAQPVSQRMLREGRDSLCRFYTHFEKVHNSDKAGPNVDELKSAASGEYYGLILTSVNEYAFCAHYYTPDGRVVSLGKFPFPR